VQSENIFPMVILPNSLDPGVVVGGRRCETWFGRRIITYDSPAVRIADHINTQEVNGYGVYQIVLGDGDKKIRDAYLLVLQICQAASLLWKRGQDLTVKFN
jgi:hypothetical protein